jgi:FHS family L-fucose permease-like MFS transporter
MDLLKKPMVILYFLGIFAYVGTEQGVANWISEFLQTYHGVNPQTDGRYGISFLGPDDRRDGTGVDPA